MIEERLRVPPPAGNDRLKRHANPLIPLPSGRPRALPMVVAKRLVAVVPGAVSSII
jgi:hypothetical protein